MKGLHNKHIINVPKAEPRGLLCSNNDVNRGSALGFDPEGGETNKPLTEGNINSLIELAKILKRIHVRLVMEGYVIEKGRIYKP